LGAIAMNLDALQVHVGAAHVMPIVKANAYGHGIVAVARKLAGLDVHSLGVAYLEEALQLRLHGVETPILVLGGFAARQVSTFLEQNLTMTVPSLEKLRQVDEAAAALGRQARVHLKVDTGMERIGVHYYNAGALLEEAARSRNVHVEGIYSHFANSDAADLSSARVQLDRFNEVCAFYDQASLPTPLRHMANSGAILQLPESHLDLVRPGIMLFGVYPSAEALRSIPLVPAMTWKTSVVYFKVVTPGHPVSYGSTWQSSVETRLVTLPVGYGDGYFRAMSGSAEVLIHGKRYPLVGRICMDQVMVDIGSDSAHNGDEVILMGASEGASISADELANWAGTIPYEILTNINARVPRIYVDNEYEETPRNIGK
ncbi:MAG: alanine racemase, partial [Acidimicrobiales bacterium]